MKKLCLILNLAPHYRKAIYKAIDEEFNCDWYVGDKVEDIKTMSPTEFHNCRVVKNRRVIKHNYVQVGICRLLFKRRYSRFLVTGDIRNISLWCFLFLSKLFPRKKVYLWTHGNNGKGGKLSNVVKKVFAKLSDGIFLYGNYARDYMVANGINPNKLFVIHNSLDYASQLHCRKDMTLTSIYRDRFGNNLPTLLFIGRLTTVKRLDLFLSAVKMLREQGSSYNVTFVGEGPEMEHLKQMVNSYGLGENVWFYGACYDEHTNAELIYNADLCVSPGNVGLTAIHSLMFGTPVATHNNFKMQMPEFEVVREGVTGTFFDYLDAKSIASAIDRWFESNSNSREVVRRNCMQEIDENWTPQYQIDVLKQHLDL